MSMSVRSRRELLGGHDGVECDGGGIRPAFTTDDRDIRALGPHVELLAGGCAVRVRGAEHHRATEVDFACLASLPTVVVLPAPLTPTTSTVTGETREQVLGVIRKLGSDLLGESIDDRRCVRQRLLGRETPKSGRRSRWSR